MFKKLTGKGTSIPTGIGLGVVLSVLITVAGAALVAYLLVSEKMEISAIGLSAIVLLGVASFAGAILGAGLAKVNRLPVCLAVGGGYFLVLLGLTALLFGGQYQGVGAALIPVLLGSAFAGLLGLKGKKGFQFKKRKVAYR